MGAARLSVKQLKVKPVLAAHSRDAGELELDPVAGADLAHVEARGGSSRGGPCLSAELLSYGGR